MKRLAILLSLLGMTAANAAPAEDPAFCKSMCSSEQRQCRADAQLRPKEETLPPADTPNNPLARAAQQGQVTSADARALAADGDNHRRMARGSSCDSGYQQCVRSCDKPKEGDKAKRKPISFG